MKSKYLLTPSFAACIIALIDIDYNNLSTLDIILIVVIFIAILSLAAIIIKSKRG